ncbi:MAG: sigma-70 family RNA polymerase sigma factor [Rikenellaceae bacterium]
MSEKVNNETILTEAIFEQFVQKNTVILYSFTKRYLNNQQEIEDIVQDSLYKLWNEREKFSTINSPHNNLFKIIKNSALNLLRNKKRLVYNSQLDPDNYSESDFLNDIIATESSFIIAEAIETLPEQSRNVMLLHLSGLKGEEIARELGISVSSVKTLKTFSMKKLAKIVPKKLFLTIF